MAKKCGHAGKVTLVPVRRPFALTPLRAPIKPNGVTGESFAGKRFFSQIEMTASVTKHFTCTKAK